MNVEEFRKYLAIDKTSLDEELIRQPELFFKVSEAYIEAAAGRDYAKEELAGVDAMQDGQLRAAKAGSTEAAIKNAIQISKAHVASYNEYLEAKTKADLWGALKDAFQQRGYMLRDLASLHTSNYFETNSVKGTPDTKDVTYRQQRERMAAVRRAK